MSFDMAVEKNDDALVQASKVTRVAHCLRNTDRDGMGGCVKVIHPKTKATLIMNEGIHFIAEIESNDTENPEFTSVTIGVIGHSTALIIYKEDWPAFKQLVSEIDAEWAI